jgi:hypothetical protein
VGLRRYRRYEALTQWEVSVAKHCPELKIPTDRKGRNRLHTQVDPVLLQDPECRARHEQCRTTIALAIELVEEAIRHKVPFGIVVFDAWYLAEDLMQVLARRRKDWISVLKTNRRLETASCHLRDAHGWTLVVGIASRQGAPDPRQLTRPTADQAAPQARMGGVVPTGPRGMPIRPGLGRRTGPLADDGRHRDGDPLLGWGRPMTVPRPHWVQGGPADAGGHRAGALASGGARVKR